jgi:hypothetical protein
MQRQLFVILASAAVFGVTGVSCTSTQTRDASGARVEAFNPPKTEQFLKKADAIKPGTPMSVVERELGSPTQRRLGTVNPRQLQQPDSATGTLADLAPVGTRYAEWVYKRGDSHFHVFFTHGVTGDSPDWQVLTVRSVPKDAVGE